LKRGGVVVVIVLVGIVLALGYRSLRSESPSEPESRPPARKVILIVLDTVRADRLGCYGNALGLTPNIDEFARGAVRFEQAFAHAPWTLPSIASLLTSQHPRQHGAGGQLPQFQMLPPEAVTLGEVFQRAGVATHAIVNVLFLTERLGMTQGFDTVDADAPATNVKVRRAEPTTDAALAWLEQHGDGPFLLMVHYFDAHLVYDPPAVFRERFADERDRDSTGYLFGTIREMNALRAGRLRLDRGRVERLKKLYNGEVAYVDAEVGRLLEGISQQGLDDETVVVITADHGEEFFEHGGFEHGHTHFDELLHVPLLMRAPNVKTRATVSTTVRQIDVAPTLCELTGVEADPDFVGQSLMPLMQGREEDDRPVLSEGNFWGWRREAWREGGMKLIRSFAPAEVQLFDVRNDPGELIDLAERAPEQRDRMVEEVKLVIRAMATEAVTSKSPVLTQEEIEHLASLGYLQLPEEEDDAEQPSEE